MNRRNAVGSLRRRPKRRAAVVVLVALLLVVMLGMGALAIDVGSMYVAMSDLQASADAAAMAAASQLVTTGSQDPTADVRAVAADFAARNKVMGVTVGVGENDVQLGKAVFDSGLGRFTFAAGQQPYDAVKVTVRRAQGSTGGALTLGFANIFGKSSKDLWASAAAMLIPRDISLVIDLSGSMNDDSELKHYKDYTGDLGQPRDAVQINLRDCWCALNGPAPHVPYEPGAETETEYASDTGPTIGYMNTWGNEIVPNTYDPASDPGLWYLPKNGTVTNATIIANLTGAGYSSAERTAILNGINDGSGSSASTQYRNRVAVMLGVATWKSGKAGGLYTSGGDGDNLLESSEMIWAAYPTFRVNWTWVNYIDYVFSNSTAMVGINNALRYRYGAKTFTNFLLESKEAYSETNILWQTPEQPLRAVKDATKTMMDVIDALDAMDHVSLEVFATSAVHELNLTSDLYSISNRLYQRQAGHYDATTNIGGGLAQARAELQSSRARTSATKIIMIMSDGKPNVDENGNYTSGDAGGNYALAQAQAAADDGMIIYTISVGGDADRALMQEIASIGHGEEFHAEGSPEEYTQQLEDIFRTLGGKRPVVLIE